MVTQVNMTNCPIISDNLHVNTVNGVELSALQKTHTCLLKAKRLEIIYLSISCASDSGIFISVSTCCYVAVICFVVRALI